MGRARAYAREYGEDRIRSNTLISKYQTRECMVTLLRAINLSKKNKVG